MIRAVQLVLLIALTVVASASRYGSSSASHLHARSVRTSLPEQRDAGLTGPFVSDLTRELAHLPFGDNWLEADPQRANCVSWVGEWDDLFPIRNWVYACDRRIPQGIRRDYAYLLGESERPTFERARYSIIPPPDARVEDWYRIEAALLDNLSRALEIPSWRNRDAERIGVGRDRVVMAELFVSSPDTGAAKPSRFTPLTFPRADTARSYGHYGGKSGAVVKMMIPIGGSWPAPAPTPPTPRHTRAAVDSLILYCFSRDLEKETREAEWDVDRGDSIIVPDSTIRYGRFDVIRALRSREPALAAVVESTVATSAQIRLVNSAVSRGHRMGPGESHDLILYAAHVWANQILDYLTGNPPRDCAEGDQAFVQEFNVAFSSRDRSEIECDHYGSWSYSGGFVDSLVTRPTANRWTTYAFLDMTAVGWNTGFCDPVGSDEFRPVIARGEAFLKANPRSEVADEVRLLVAEAHETAWSLGKMNPGDEYVPATTYATDASAHRARAVQLYEWQLRNRPSDTRNAGIRKRLARIRLDVDTGYRRFWCSNE